VRRREGEGGREGVRRREGEGGREREGRREGESKREGGRVLVDIRAEAHSTSRDKGGVYQ
jgi:hypothetical protein